MKPIPLSRATIALSLFIIVSATFMRPVVNFLIDSLGGRTVDQLISFGFIVALIVLWQPIRRALALQSLQSLLLGLGILTVVVIAAYRLEIAIERAHFLEFGLLGWLGARDCRGLAKPKDVSFPFAWALLVACVDEFLQTFIPSRFGDLRDIGFAAIGAGAGVALYTILYKKN